MKNIAVLVLAAGKSSRMNGIKQLEKINNQTLLDITLEKAKQLSKQHVFCVLGANSDKIKSELKSKDVIFLENKNFENGLSSSIVCGINHFKKEQLNFDGVFILLADQPAIEVSYLESLIYLFDKNTTKIIASNYGKQLGVPAIFSRKYFSELLLIKGDKGAKDFIIARNDEVISAKKLTNLIDIDTQDDLQKFKMQLNS